MFSISRLKLRNFKSFKAADVQLSDTFVCFAGPNGSGKCVDGDTGVCLADGSTVKIRDFVNEALENGLSERMDDGFIARLDNAREILSLDTKTLKITKKKVGAFVKRKSPEKMLRIRTRSGRDITATEYHPLFILEKNEVRPIRADRLREGTRIAVPRVLPVECKDNLFLELINLIKIQDNVYAPYSKEIAGLIRKRKGDMTWEEMEKELSLPNTILTSYIHSRQAMLFPYLVRALRYCGLQEIEIARLITHVKGRRGGLMRMQWQNSNEFCRFLGYMLAEGSISRAHEQVRLVNGSEEIINDFKELAEQLFGLKVSVARYKKNASDLIIYSSTLKRLLLRFGMSFDGAEGKHIPDMLLKHSTNEQLGHLLSGLFSGDGYVSKTSIEITLKSRKLVKSIENILLRFGIVPRTRVVSKRETKSGYVGTYYNISIYEAENQRIFSENVLLIHNEKRARLSPLIERKTNPNVDLIEANTLVKETVEELGINLKRSKKEFPRLDAYCYDQCLPSRHGLKHLVTKAFRPIAAQKSRALERLETLACSDIFWDEIVSIEKMTPKDEWVYDLSVSDHHNFIANGVIVHNSNLCDAIRFAMGETSLRSLRARKVKELIHAGAKSAETTLVFNNGDKRMEIRRVIREDGKIMYRLDGKRTTRGAILEALKRFNLDGSGRNTIAQGEVQRIIDMNGKERRLFIDNVAGIADFEEKKKEALRELDTVENRIKDASLVLGERRTFLKELGREREVAIRYTDARKTLTNAKGTLLKTEVERLEKDLESVVEKEDKLVSETTDREKELEKINKEIGELETKRHETSEELRSKQKTNTMIRRLEELKASSSSKKQLIEDRQGFIERTDEERKAVEREIAEERKAIEGLEKDADSLRKELEKAESELTAHGGAAEDQNIVELRKALYEHEQELSVAKERLISLTSEIKSKKEIIKAKKEEWESIAAGAMGDDSSEDMEDVKAEIERIAADIEKSFSKTKEVNARIAELDREMLELKEKASIFKVRTSPRLANPALSLIGEMKDAGIHGIMADLITFDPRYASAVEAAGGARLLYVVVDSVDTATGIIEKLKKAKAGRATFIPLDSIRTQAPVKEGRFGSVLDVVDCNGKVRRAAEYLFADTLLVDRVSDAKKVGIGKARMVTVEGEIFERSGIVSGGRAQSSILSANQLRKIEAELADVKSQKESLVQELYAIREEEAKMRAEKSQLEIKAKTTEMKRTMAEEKRKETEQAVKRKEKLADEIGKLEEAVEAGLTEKEKLTVVTSQKHDALTIARKKLEAAEKEYKELSEESSRERADLSGEVSSLREKIEAKRNEAGLRAEECRSKEERLGKLAKDEKTAEESIKKVKAEVVEEQKQVAELEEKISSASKAIEKLFEKVRDYEKELQFLGEKRGEIRMTMDKLNKDMNQLEIRKATTTTRLEDIKSELSEFSEVEFVDAGRDELSKMIAQSEAALAELGNVNMASIDMYDKKKAEIEDVEMRIEKLDKEREAILSMIDEIEEHKKEAFFETFDAVNKNFTNLFDHISIGKGHLYLNNPTNPFESGLFIKLRRGNKEHSLDALSGGEKTLVALMFVFALQFFKPAPFYVLDEVDAALDKPNSKNLADLIMGTQGSQFIVVTHNDTVMSNSDAVIGVTKTGDVSKLVGIKIKQVAAA